MERMRRSVSFVLLLTLLSGWLAVAPAPEARANLFDPNYTVTTTRDLLGAACKTDLTFPQECSLRQALNKAIADGGNKTVSFAIERTDSDGEPMPGYDALTNTWTITLTSALPIITVPNLIIEGDTQATASGSDNLGPLIFLDGTNITNRGGLTLIGSNGSRISRLGIIKFRGNPAVSGDLAGVGIEISVSTGASVVGCSIGVGQDGITSKPNYAAGILIQGGSGNIIGGNNSANDEFNIISGNTNDGVLIRFSNDNRIIGNRIGVNRNGTAAIPNLDNGIQLVLGSSGNRVGSPADQSPTDATLRNTIAGNGGFGVLINESINTQINGNWIGANNALNIRLPNREGGVGILSTVSGPATGNRIGGDTSTARNVISGNNGPGISITGPTADDNVVGNNFIGIGFSSSIALSNTIGVLISEGGDRNIIGGNGTLTRNNVISGNSGDGVQISGKSLNRAIGNIVSGNLIGIGPNGSTARRNGGSGVAIGSYVQRSTIGAAADTGANQIANNDLDGIRLSGTSVISNTILRNQVASNQQNGVHLNGPSQTVLDGNAVNGLTVTANTFNGIRATSATSTTIRFANSSSNTNNGVYVTGGSVTSILTSTVSLNRKEGILADGASSKLAIRGTRSVTNTLSGLHLSGTSDVVADNNTLNANQQHGALVDLLATNVDITNSSIFSNTLTGVTVDGSASPSGTQPVEITSNRISGNGVPQNGPFPATPPAGSSGNGIKLVGTTTGSPGSNTRPNHDIDPPFNLRINNRGRLTGRVRANNLEPSSCLPGDKCRIQVFTTNPQTLDGQGLQQLNVPVTITSNGYFTATLGSVPPQLAVTATDQAGNTSEFSIWTRSYAGLQIGPPRSGTAAPGQTITYTHRITNTSTVDFDDLRLSTNSKLQWTVVPAPGGDIALGVGENKPVTVTITLPTGSAENVRADLVEQTRVTIQSTSVPTATASVTDTTTVLGRFILSITPPSATGFGVPGQPIDYVHTLTNLGNSTGTVSLASSTTLGGLPAPTWTTTITPAQITLGPGKAATTSVRVNVPPGAQAERDVAVTRTLVTGSATNAITDTTVVTLTQFATMLPSREADAGPGEKVTFEHTVTNLSNGRATFKLSGSSSLGSALKFRGIPGGATLNPDNSFTIDNRPGTNVFTFLVEITVDPRARQGQKDQVTLSLTDKGGATIFASVQDTINIVRNPEIRTYLPAVYR